MQPRSPQQQDYPAQEEAISAIQPRDIDPDLHDFGIGELIDSLRGINLFEIPISFDDDQKQKAAAYGLRTLPVKLTDDDNARQQGGMLAIDPVTFQMPSHMVFAGESNNCISPYFTNINIGAFARPIIRTSVFPGLLIADQILTSHRRRICVVDGWRPPHIQSRIFQNVFERTPKPEQPTILDTIQIGSRIGQNPTYRAPRYNTETPAFKEAVDRLIADPKSRPQLAEAVRALYPKINLAHAGNLTLPEIVASIYLMYEYNLSSANNIPFDLNPISTNGDGGSTDIVLLDETGSYFTCLGTPYLYHGEAAQLDWFENRDNLPKYIHLSQTDPGIKAYLAAYNIDTPTLDDFLRIRNERRLLYYALKQAGASANYHAHNHYNWGNIHNGEKNIKHPGAGGKLHSYLQNIQDENGNLIAVWDDASALELGKRFYQ